MAILKVIEVLSSSKTGWEDAARTAVAEASKSLRGIKSINISNQSAVVDNGKIVEYRVNCKLSFEVEA
jgi:dodecin